MNDLRSTFWYAMLEVDLSRLYYSRVAGRFHSWDLWLKIFVAVMSSGTVAGWSFWSDPIKHPNFVLTWKMMSGLSAVAAVVMPLLNLSKKVEWSMSLHNSYSKILAEYELNWAQIDSFSPAKIVSVLKELNRSEEVLASVESHFPKHDERLVKKCQATIIRKRANQ